MSKLSNTLSLKNIFCSLKVAVRQLSCRNIDKTLPTVVVFLVLLLSKSVFAAPITASTGHSDGITHLEFTGRSEWDYQLKREKRQVRLFVTNLDDKSKVVVQSFHSPFVKSIDIKPDIEGRSELVFELKDDSIRVFDYQTDQPSRLILDFYISDKSEDKKAVSDPKTQDSDKSTKSTIDTKQGKKKTDQAKTDGKKVGERKPAGTDFVEGEATPTVLPKPSAKMSDLKLGAFDGADPSFERFSIKEDEIREEAIIASKKNVFINFPRVKLVNTDLQDLIEKSPEYEITPQDTAENKEARLLLTLFKKNRPSVFLKTLGMFREKYANSKYEELMRYLEADIYYGFWTKDHSLTDYDKAVALLKKNWEKYSNSPLAERTGALIIQSQLERGDFLGVLATQIRYEQKFPTSKYSLSIKLASALAYAGLNRGDDALAKLLDIENDKNAGTYATHAAFLRGDIFFDREQYGQSISSYQRAMAKYPNEVSSFPNLYYNMAEAQFRSEYYKEANVNYREFLRHHPAHENAGYALTRVGEVLEILGAKPEKIEGAYLESLFRYPNTQGAQVARVRMISKKMSEMKDKEAVSVTEEVNSYMKSSTLPRFDYFARVMLSDGHYNRGNYDNSIQFLTEHYSKQTTKIGLELELDRIVRNITKKLQNQVENGDYINLIRSYGKFNGEWLQKADRLDVQYYLGYSFEKTGVPEEAERVYRDVLNRMYSMNKKEQKQRAVFENLPSSDSMNLRLAKVEVEKNQFTDSAKYMSQIKNRETLSDNEKIEIAQIASLIAEKQGNLELAKQNINTLIDAWKGVPEQVVPAYLKLAELQFKTKDYLGAENSLKKIVFAKKDSAAVDNNTMVRAMELLGELYVKAEKLDDAAGVYKFMLEKYEAERPLGSTRYQLGEIYFKQGDLKQAETWWAPMKEKKEYKSWYQIAKEKMDSEKWKDNYKKYIGRLPASTGLGKE